MVSIIEQIMTTKYKISFSRVVSPVFGSCVKAAMRPKTVRSPVACKSTRQQVCIVHGQWVGADINDLKE